MQRIGLVSGVALLSTCLGTSAHMISLSSARETAARVPADLRSGTVDVLMPNCLLRLDARNERHREAIDQMGRLWARWMATRDDRVWISLCGALEHVAEEKQLGPLIVPYGDGVRISPVAVMWRKSDGRALEHHYSNWMKHDDPRAWQAFSGIAHQCHGSWLNTRAEQAELNDILSKYQEKPDERTWLLLMDRCTNPKYGKLNMWLRQQGDYTRLASERILTTVDAAANPALVDEIGQRYARWCNHPSEESFARLDGVITSCAAKLKIVSKVTFKTQDGTGKKTAGAIVKYRFVGRENIRDTNPTPTIENISIGTYEMWSERNKKETSLRRRKSIGAEVELVKLVEDQ